MGRLLVVSVVAAALVVLVVLHPSPFSPLGSEIASEFVLAEVREIVDNIQFLRTFLLFPRPLVVLPPRSLFRVWQETESRDREGLARRIMPSFAPVRCSSFILAMEHCDQSRFPKYF